MKMIIKILFAFHFFFSDRKIGFKVQRPKFENQGVRNSEFFFSFCNITSELTGLNKTGSFATIQIPGMV